MIETIERITAEDNACSKKTKKTITIKRKPGASPLLFGKYLMDHCAFVGLEDISASLPSYREEVVPVAMEKVLKTAYEQLEEEITACLKEHRGNHSVVSTMLNTLLAWPDHPYGFGTLYGTEFNPETKGRERFVIAETVDLDTDQMYAKDVLTAMAREPVENRGIGESADSVWRRLCPAPAAQSPEDSAEAAIVPAEVETPEPLPLIAEQIPNAALLEAVNLPRHVSRKGTAADQLSLF